VAQRDWDGVVQVSSTSSCSNEPCLAQENGPLNEPFVLTLCYSSQRPSGVLEFDDGGLALGQVERSRESCLSKSFMIQDGVVEIGPGRGASCAASTDCEGENELCFDGSCTTGCPANDYPSPGTSNLGLVKDDMGFFTESARPEGQQYTGTGTITATLYQGGTLKIYLTRPGATEPQLGTLSVAIPSSSAVTLQAGTTVSVTFLDNGQKQAKANRAVVIRDAASTQVLFAADMAQGGPLLTDADLAPLAVSSGEVPIGCRMSDCGRHLYFTRRLASGAQAVDVEPGERGTLVLGDGTWEILSLSNGVSATQSCEVPDLRPWVLWRAAGR
jgi:hypothetical protein